MEQLPSERANRRYLMFGAWLVALLVLLNVFLLQIAREDRSWLVLGLMFLGPLLNLSVGGVSCLNVPAGEGNQPGLLRLRSRGARDRAVDPRRSRLLSVADDHRGAWLLRRAVPNDLFDSARV